MKTATSIRQPVVLYAVLFMLLASFAVLTTASFALVRASNRAYRRAANEQLRALAAGRSAGEIETIIKNRHDVFEFQFGVVTATKSALGLNTVEARELAFRGVQRDRASTRIADPRREAYLVAILDPTIPTSIAFSEIARLLPLVLLGALMGAGLLAYALSRLLMSPLAALAEVAETDRPDSSMDLVASDAPNEFLEVARRFKSTVRSLNNEREIVEAQRDELAQMQESLVRASKLASVGRLAAGIAHEIGNPLAALKGYLSLVKRDLPPDERKEIVERSGREIDRIHATIKQLLMYARQGEAGPEAVRPFSSHHTVHEAAKLLKNHPMLRNVELVLEVEDEGEDAQGHPGRLHQVIVNLLLNAAQAIGGSDSPGSITVARKLRPDGIELWFSDTGPGVPEDLREAIFDPFFTTKDPGEGTGLGLAVSRAVMEAMGGDLSLKSAEVGATFVIRLQPA